jgi:hypothetical protein
MKLLPGIVCVAALALPVFSVMAGDEKAAERAERGGPCMEDVKRLCPEAKTKEEVQACMKQHRDELSPACKEAGKKGADFLKACKDDMKKLCSSVERGGGRILRCLKENESSLSESCRSAIQNAQ